MRRGLVAAQADPEAFLRNRIRCVGDRAWGRVRFAAAKESDRQWAQRCWFQGELFWATQDKLTAAVELVVGKYDTVSALRVKLTDRFGVQWMIECRSVG